MSIGLYAIAKKTIEYKDWAFYTYAGENWNIQPTQNGDVHLQDGSIVIWKACFETLDSHGKSKEFPDVEKHLVNGDIVIRRPCKNENRNFYAIRLLREIFIFWQENGKLPETVRFLM